MKLPHIKRAQKARKNRTNINLLVFEDDYILQMIA